jgi:hypothetical protein
MRRILTGAIAVAIAAPLLLAAAPPATAQIAHPQRLQAAAVGDDVLMPVRWRGGGAGLALGLGAGMLLGGALAAGAYPYGYGYGPYYPPPYAYGPPPGDAVAYCMQRFRSYDPGSGTYLGRDGYRHPCP